MKILKFKSFEKIILDIEKGDFLYGGRFKNKKVLVKKIGKNAKGDITVNGKPLLKYRLVKESLESFEEDTIELLLPIRDMGMQIQILSGDGFGTWKGKTIGGMTRIFTTDKKNSGSDTYSFDSDGFDWKSIEADVQLYVSYMTEELGYDFNMAYYIGDNSSGGSSIHSEQISKNTSITTISGYQRVQIEQEDILEGRIPENIKMIAIGFAK